MRHSRKTKSKHLAKATSPSTKYRKATVYAKVVVTMNLPHEEKELPAMAKMRIEVEHFDDIKVQKILGVYFDGKESANY